MKGINPVLFKISFLSIILVCSMLSLFYYGFIFIFLLSFILFGVMWLYYYIKVENIDKGKLLYKINRPCIETLRFLFILMIISVFIKFLPHSNGLCSYLSFLLLL